MHQPYPSDVSRKQFEKVRPFRRRRGSGRSPVRLICRRFSVVFLYVLKSGCQWRMLPKDFP